MLETFKIILDETTNKITTTIISATAGGASATRGIENHDGDDGDAGVMQHRGLRGREHVADLHAVRHDPARPRISRSPEAPGPTASLTWTINSNARSAPVVLVASLDPGPLNLGALGILNIGLTPGLYAVIADGAGALGPPNPAHATDWYCGDFSISLPLGAGAAARPHDQQPGHRDQHDEHSAAAERRVPHHDAVVTTT